MGGNGIKRLLTLLLTLIACLLLASCSREDYGAVSCPYALKQLHMFSEQTGWGLSAENEVLYTEDGIENLKPVKKVETAGNASDQFATNAVFMDEKSAYIAYFSSDNEHLIVEYTRDGGSNWGQTNIKYNGYADAGSVFLDFSDDGEGFLLYCSTPAAGMMAKFLFVSDDAGETFTFAEDLSGTIAGYPQGITAVSGEQLYIAVTYHGVDNYLYQSSDSGGTWNPVEIFPRADGDGYVDGYAPIFYDNDSQSGIIILKVVQEETAYQLFTTGDSGSIWTFSREIPCDSLLDYSLSGNGGIYVIDQAGNLHTGTI